MAFNMCTRWSTKSIIGALQRFPNVLTTTHYSQMAAGLPKVSYKKFEPEKIEHHDIKNARLGRPLSPHLSIYSPQLTTILSITHRTSGIILSGYFTVLGIGALVLPHDISHYISMIEALNLSPATIFLAKAVLASPFAYHLANGMRHLYWDTARGLSIKEVYKTGYTMLATAVALTLLFAAL